MMKILISPAKSMNFGSIPPTGYYSTPFFDDEIIRINTVLKKKSIRTLCKMLKISDNLAQLNYDRNQSFSWPIDNQQAMQALFAFTGDVYKGIDSFSLSQEQIRRLQGSLYILSGLYGLLRPLDLILPYRLEMGTKIRIGNHPNLYKFWKNKITKMLINHTNQNDLVVNLASNEYAKAVDFSRLHRTVVTPIFKDFKNGQLKVIQFFAKKARGLMVRHISTSQSPDLSHLLNFQSDGYQYSPKDSQNELNPVFIR